MAKSKKTKTKDQLPRTYLFKTREGNVGLFQLRKVVDGVDGVRLRYKIKKPKSASIKTPLARISLQDNTPPAKIIPIGIPSWR